MDSYGIMTSRGWVTSGGFIKTYPTHKMALENSPPGGIPVSIELEDKNAKQQNTQADMPGR